MATVIVLVGVFGMGFGLGEIQARANFRSQAKCDEGHVFARHYDTRPGKEKVVCKYYWEKK